MHIHLGVKSSFVYVFNFVKFLFAQFMFKCVGIWCKWMESHMHAQEGKAQRKKEGKEIILHEKVAYMSTKLIIN